MGTVDGLIDITVDGMVVLILATVYVHGSMVQSVTLAGSFPYCVNTPVYNPTSCTSTWYFLYSCRVEEVTHGRKGAGSCTHHGRKGGGSCTGVCTHHGRDPASVRSSALGSGCNL